MCRKKKSISALKLKIQILKELQGAAKRPATLVFLIERASKKKNRHLVDLELKGIQSIFFYF